MTTVPRRTALGLLALLPLSACAGDPTTAPPRGPGAPSSPAPTSPTPSTPAAGHPALVALEREYGARLGVYALATGTGAEIAHRADERFAFCSTFKALAVAAVLDRNPLSHLDTVLEYTEADLLPHAPVTERHVATGMTVRDVCDAAIRYSDGTAGNLLLRDLGGPGELTAFSRTLGDRVFRLDRTEPDLAAAIPGDPRDTTSPRAMGTDFRRLVLGDALPADRRAVLRDLLERNTTGDRRIRAGLPSDWTVADKTGTGGYGTINDVAVVWPPGADPLVIALLSTTGTADREYDETLLARAAGHVAETLT